MNTEELWKNFKMNEELDIAGSFIFNGIRTLDEIDNFSNSQDIFMFFYQTSVGIERLLKIALVLSEDDLWIDEEKFKKSIKNHKHIALLQNINKGNSKIILEKNCNVFIEILMNFYKNNRYGRFKIFNNDSAEKDILKKYLEKVLPKGANIDAYFEGTSGRGFKVPQEVKKSLGNIVKKISIILYKRIQEECFRLNIFTYETRVYSKAQNIFLSKLI